MSSYAIETDQLTRVFGTRRAVDRLSLLAPAESVCGFLGPNGAGKTTTIRLLLGLLTPTDGSIVICDQPASRRTADWKRRLGAAVETPSLYPHLTGRQNLEIFRTLLDLDPSRIEAGLAAVQLMDDADRRVREYSLGMRQRLALARALLPSPQLLVLDEPMNGLDPAGVRDLRDLLRQLAHDAGVTVFLSSHLLGEVEQIADWIAVIDNGQLRFQGTLNAFQSQRERRLSLRVDRVDEAIAALSRRGLTVVASSDGFLRFPMANDQSAAEVNALLVSEGISVYEISTEGASLEALFLSATQSNTTRASS